MKRIIAVCIGMLMLAGAGAQGIEFFNGSLAEASEQAKKEGKLIFVDAYTTWCGPCKMMSKQVFTDEDVAAYFNANFINLKIDQEKGEGINFAKEYAVRYYPTFVFLDDNGTLMHKAVGYKDVSDFIQLGERANSKEQQMYWLETQYNKGKLKASLYPNLAYALKEAMRYELAQNVITFYLLEQKDWKATANVQLILDHFPKNVESKLFTFALKEKSLLKKVKQDSDWVEARIYEAITNSLAEEGELSDQEIDAFFKTYYPTSWQKESEKHQITALQKNPETQNSQEYFEKKIAYLQKYPSKSWQELNSIAWGIYESTDDEELLKAAKSFAKQSMEKEANYYNTDTYTWICVKLGDLESASKYAVKAKKLGEEMDADVSELEIFLESLPK